jgi:acyl-[acyl-carrier-protein]-phospholipid O-acyltransferase/long-chain-fatty-acid--[acyl-carrier-protein] ligase
MQLQQRFIEVAKKYPNDIAIIDVSAGKSFTYSKLLMAALVLAEKYKKFPEKNIGVMIPTSFGCLVTTIALLIADKTPVMINYSVGAIQNVKYAQEKCNFMTTITTEKLLDKLSIKPIEGMVNIEDLLGKVSLINKVKGLTISKFPSQLIQKFAHTGDPDDTAVILFTSGSEKDPKAVQLSHKNIMHNVVGFKQVINNIREDVFLANLPLFHVFGITVTFWTPLLYGGKTVTIANPLDYKLVCRSIKKHKVTLIVGTPTFYHGYLHKSEAGDFDSVKLAISGADKLPKQIRDEYLKKHNLELYEGYGTTETSPVISTNYKGNNKVGTVGKPLPGTQVKIIDRVTGKEVKPGVEGKILVKGDLVTTGYYNDYEETSLRIRDGWYDTGDMGVIDKDGYITHRGRLRRFVKIGGEMVSLTKVESVLETILPAETLCCVVDVPNLKKGAEIVAAVTTKEVEAKQIHKYMKKELPSLMVPKEYYVLDELPLMPSGKVNFRKVEEIIREIHNSKKNKK